MTGRIALALLLATGASARAFTFQSSISDGCHERITLEALAIAGWPDGARPPAPTEIDERIADDVPFDPPPSARNPWAIALLVGVRYNDLRDVSPDDLSELTLIHGDSDTQREHCLRSFADEGPAGDGVALAACRQFIVEQLTAALDGGPDLEAREPIAIHLVFRGRVDVPLARFAFHAGRALHALQDGFSHTFRAPDGYGVDAVLNFVLGVQTRGHYSEPVDGYRHLARLDRCGDDILGQKRRVRLATEASARLLAAIADGTGGNLARLARAERVLDDYLTLRPGCNAQNRWCHAGELDEPDPIGGCSLSSRRAGGDGGTIFLVVGGLLLARARRAPSSIRKHTCMLAIAVACMFAKIGAAGAFPDGRLPVPPPVPSASPGGGGAAPKEARPVPPTAAAEARGARGTYCHCLGIAVALGGAIDGGAMFGSVGARWDPAPRWELGLDGEYNPFYSLENRRVVPGVLNFYATVGFRLLALRSLELRATAHVGMSILLFDLVGADAGSVGPFLGLSPLGVAIHLGHRVWLTIDPGELDVAVPKLRGVPFVYRQHRLSVGLSWKP